MSKPLAHARAPSGTLPLLTPALHRCAGRLVERLGISSKTLLRRKASGEMRPAMVLGRRGRAAVRWRAP